MALSIVTLLMEETVYRGGGRLSPRADSGWFSSLVVVWGIGPEHKRRSVLENDTQFGEPERTSALGIQAYMVG
jgi:hypothetical protein